MEKEDLREIEHLNPLKLKTCHSSEKISSFIIDHQMLNDKQHRSIVQTLPWKESSGDAPNAPMSVTALRPSLHSCSTPC